VLRDGDVVGQTTRRALHVPVTLGHRHSLAVVPLGRGGRARCGALKRMRVAFRMPGAPQDLVASGDERGLTLSWRPGRRGDGKPAGYRLLRNGSTVGQTARPSWRLRAVPNRRYRFAVVAVDSAGHLSRQSNSVTLALGHHAPSTPADVQAIAVSESEIGVSWQPSRVGAGRIVGYRILRDGVVVRQVSGSATSTLLENLAPSTTYRIAVVAIDGLGYVSAASPEVSVRTQQPVPTSGHAHAFLLATTDQSFADFRAHYRQIGYVYPTDYDCAPDATLSGRDDPLVTRWAEARKVKTMPRVNCQRTSVVHQILTDPATRAAWLDQLVKLAADVPYDGISLDFEAGPASDRAALTSFVTELANRLHADGRLLTLAVSPKAKDVPTHPRSGIFDYVALSRSPVDWLFVMAWGLHWSTSAPGAQDDAAWTKGIADYVATMPDPGRFVYGTNLYAMDWPAGGGPSHVATAYEYDDIVPRLPSLGASTALDPASDAYHATYTDANGVGHDVWFPDATTIGHRISLAAGDGFGGVGFWRLGREDQRLWDDARLLPGATW
jgi:spore germination protein YaaH